MMTLNKTYLPFIENRINQKTKPLGSLGLLEKVAAHLALIQSQSLETATSQIEINNPVMLIFAGDHGIAQEGVSIAPSEVTQQMVMNFLHGGAATNCFCRVNDIDISVVDCGILRPVQEEASNLITQRLGNGTANFSRQAAMSVETVKQGLEFGEKVAQLTIERGSNLLLFGEMGIGNTSSAAAILSALSKKPAKMCVGYGTGISQQQLTHKIALVETALVRCETDEPIEILAELGGFEIVQMVGAFIGSAKRNVPVLVDGFIVTVAAYVATKLVPECREWMIFAHRSEEQGHQILLDELEAAPLLDMGLRLGEGTGAALALPLVRAAAEFYNNMASFESAGVTV